ncbi:hypothetical protein QQ054_04930 [Oscillatoria amoena NRMC-F 0135]|nr:hypothetical protein [Oscillatoria amoena NRMC-F 0135]
MNHKQAIFPGIYLSGALKAMQESELMIEIDLTHSTESLLEDFINKG